MAILGISDYDIPAFDPLEVATAKTSEVAPAVAVPKTIITGLGNVRVLAARPFREAPGRFRLEVDTQIPNLAIQGNYQADGFTDVFNVGGNGLYTPK